MEDACNGLLSNILSEKMGEIEMLDRGSVQGAIAAASKAAAVSAQISAANAAKIAPPTAPAPARAPGPRFLLSGPLRPMH